MGDFCYLLDELFRDMNLIYPVKVINISQNFGVDNTNDPVKKDFYTLFDNKHPGVDFDLPENTDVFASFDGICFRNEFHKGMGNVVGLRYKNIVILYAHLNKVVVNLGDVVYHGQLIGLSGNTGTAVEGNPHLHFEIRNINKSPLKEMVFDPPFGSKIDCLEDIVYYTVKNDNTPKTLRLLSERYFGSSKYTDKIKNINESLAGNSDIEVLKDGLVIKIPNYD